MERPIGYWVKRLDRLIETAFDRVFAGEGLTRRHWQVMNVLHTSPQTAAELTEAMRPFWSPGTIALGDVTSELTHRGWLTHDDASRCRLTPAGQAAHATVQQKVQAIRSTFLTGLTEDDYHRTVRFLQQMAGNLESAARHDPPTAPG